MKPSGVRFAVIPVTLTNVMHPMTKMKYFPMFPLLRRVEGGACCLLSSFPPHFAGPAVVSSVWGDVEVASAHGVVAFAVRSVLRVSHHLARFLLSMPAWIASIRVEVRRGL